MNKQVQTIWLVSREYAGIAEAGGVKNVVCSLAEGLVRQNRSVTVFIPRYASVSIESSFRFACDISVAHQVYSVVFTSAMYHGVELIFVDASVFNNKHSVYVYTEDEANTIPGAVRGKGHFDVDIMNMLLQKAVAEYSLISGLVPDVLHGQDAHTAILPALIRTNDRYCSLFAHTVIAITIHNSGPGYRQVIPYSDYASVLTGLDESVLKRAVFNGNIEPFLLAAEYGVLTTVSPWYAKELTTHQFDRFTEGLSGEFERRGISITGITNGIDYDKYNAQDTTCSLLPFAFDPAKGDLKGKYLCRAEFLSRIARFQNNSTITCFGTINPEPHAVYYSYHGRIAWQKGLDIFEKSAEIVLNSSPKARFIILGQGDIALESILIHLSEKYVGRFVYLRGYERVLARMAVAVADFLVLPSIFEPCGLEDFIGQIYGTIPVAHAVGGLQKIIHGESGFLYSSDPSKSEAEILAQLMLDVASPIIESNAEGCSEIPTYLGMIQYAAAVHVRETYSWDSIILHQYLPLYEKNNDKNT